MVNLELLRGLSVQELRSFTYGSKTGNLARTLFLGKGGSGVE